MGNDCHDALLFALWIPACAGMTRCDRRNDEVGGDLNHDCHDLGMIAMMPCPAPLDSRLRGNDGRRSRNDGCDGDLNHDGHDGE